MSGIRVGGLRLAILLAASIAACSSPTPAQPSVASSTPAPTGTGVTATEPGPTEEVAGPPAATLAAEGGDPVTGQLGTYIWAGGGSDSPWLRGAKVSVGHDEPLIVSFHPDIAIDSWTAWLVPASATGPAGAQSLGAGVDVPHVAAPKAGAWTLEVTAVFADGAGNAAYFWELDVS